MLKYTIERHIDTKQYVVSTKNNSIKVVDKHLSKALSNFSSKVSYELEQKIMPVVEEVTKDFNPIRIYAKIDENLDLILAIALKNQEDARDFDKQSAIGFSLGRQLHKHLLDMGIILNIRFCFLTEEDVKVLENFKNSLSEIVQSFQTPVPYSWGNRSFVINNFFRDDLDNILNALKE